MKKVLLLLSTLFFSLLLVNNVYAQEYPNYPSHLMKANYYPFLRYPIAEHNNTYEYEADYSVDVIFESIDEIEYYLFVENVSFKKGIDRRTNSYEITKVTPYTSLGYTAIYVRVTLLKTVVNEYSDNPPEFPTDLFRYYSAFYITYMSDTGSIEYDSGYHDGFETGYNRGFEDGSDEGYNIGYHDGRSDGYYEGYDNGYNTGYTEGLNASQPDIYRRGYNDGYNVGYEDASNEAPKKFMNNLHHWIVPAIIVVVVAGIFVGYRRERYYND